MSREVRRGEREVAPQAKVTGPSALSENVEPPAL
jgi:hypothetical protein